MDKITVLIILLLHGENAACDPQCSWNPVASAPLLSKCSARRSSRPAHNTPSRASAWHRGRESRPSSSHGNATVPLRRNPSEDAPVGAP